MAPKKKAKKGVAKGSTMVVRLGGPLQKKMNLQLDQITVRLCADNRRRFFTGVCRLKPSRG